MEKEEILRQLRNLKEHCEEMGEERDASEVWQRDVDALQEAINILEK